MPTKLERVLHGFTLFLLEAVDFLQLSMEPFFKWLPILGLLYVLVPYYNQIQVEFDCLNGRGKAMKHKCAHPQIPKLNFIRRTG